jgi:hypothetical protein
MPQCGRRKHRAQTLRRARASAGLTAIGTVGAVITVFLIVVGSVLTPSGAATHKPHHHRTRIFRPTRTVTATATSTITARPTWPYPTRWLPTPTATVTVTPSPSWNPSTAPTSTPTGTPTSSPSSVGGFGTGTYMGPYSAITANATVGYVQGYSTMYLEAASVTTPNISKLEAELKAGTSPILDLEFKTGPFTMAQIAAWGPDVQAYFKTFVGGLQTLTDYAASLDNGTHVLFSVNHEAVVKINQKKYSFSQYDGGQPTIADSAAAWNKAMSYVAATDPDVVRLYWYGGSGQNESTYAADLQPSLIQAASFDPYRWSHDQAGDTAQSLWGSMVSSLKAQSWMQNSNGTLKPWGLTEWGTDATFGDASNATFVKQALSYLQDQGASFAVYFDRQDGSNNFVFTDGSEPQTVAAYSAAAK